MAQHVMFPFRVLMGCCRKKLKDICRLVIYLHSRYMMLQKIYIMMPVHQKILNGQILLSLLVIH